MHLLPALRDGGRVPVIVMTARDQLRDRLAGLDGGADDYVVKPVEMPELLARCRAVLRRPGDRSDTILRFGALELDTAARSVSWDGRSVALGRRETTVLEHLMRAVGRVAPRRTLEEAVYGFDDEVGPNALEASVSRLRRALAAAGCPLPIVTVRGVGWMLPRDDAR
jgi:two-component system OmpR family response regulator